MENTNSHTFKRLDFPVMRFVAIWAAMAVPERVITTIAVIRGPVRAPSYHEDLSN